MRQLPKGQTLSLDDRHHYIRLDWNEAPEPPPIFVMNAIAEYLHRVHEYPPADCTELETMIAEWHGIDPKMVVLTAGADAALRLALLWFPNGSTVGWTVPNYGYVKQHVLAARHFSKITRSIIPTITGLRSMNCDVLYVSNPMAQLGDAFHSDSIKQLSSFLVRTGGRLIVDETYAEFSELQPSVLSGMSDSAAEPIVIRSLSKAFRLAGLRVGYLVASSEIANRIRELRPLESVNIIGYVAARAAVEQHEWFLRDIRDGVMVRRRYVVDRLRQIGLSASNTHTNFIRVHMEPGTAESCRMWLEERARILVRHIPDYPGVLRISIGTDVQMNSLCEAMEVWKETCGQ